MIIVKALNPGVSVACLVWLSNDVNIVLKRTVGDGSFQNYTHPDDRSRQTKYNYV